MFPKFISAQHELRCVWAPNNLRCQSDKMAWCQLDIPGLPGWRPRHMIQLKLWSFHGAKLSPSCLDFKRSTARTCSCWTRSYSGFVTKTQAVESARWALDVFSDLNLSGISTTLSQHLQVPTMCQPFLPGLIWFFGVHHWDFLAFLEKPSSWICVNRSGSPQTKMDHDLSMELSTWVIKCPHWTSPNH